MRRSDPLIQMLAVVREESREEARAEEEARVAKAAAEANLSAARLDAEARDRARTIASCERETLRRTESRAHTFLASLDPQSKLGVWFAGFAKDFGSRFDAAVAYVEALAETERFLG